MSEFQWKDKSSKKWYVIYPHGHEGPYSLDYLQQKLADKVFTDQIKVWSEGLPSDLTLEAVISLASAKEEKAALADELPPPLPPLPTEEVKAEIEVKKEEKKTPKDLPREEIIPTLPSVPEKEQEIKKEIPWPKEVQQKVEEDLEEVEVKRKSRMPAVILVLFFVISMLGGVFYYLKEKKQDVTFIRPQGMSLKVEERIEKYLQFKGWNEQLFLKEFVSEDYNSVWLATSSFHTCSVKAHFKSQNNKLLSLNDEEVEFETSGVLKEHLTEFRKINFISGKKIIPGMYDMTIDASDCQWDGVVPLVMNLFKQPEASYNSKMSVILYTHGADEFKDLLEKILRKKLDKAIQEQNQVELFWQGIQEKLQTLLAISLQIEQLMLDFIHKDARKFHVNLPEMINEYTQKYGKFLTNFVVANEESFEQMKLQDIKGISVRRNYEMEISSAAKMIGFTSMKLIEDFQELKNPRRVKLNEFEERTKREYAQLKNSINQKIIQVSDDRSLSPGEDQEEDNPSQD